MRYNKFADPEIALKEGILEYYRNLYDLDTRKATNFRRARRTNWKKSILIKNRKGLISEAVRIQKFANIVLSQFHEYITSKNTKIRKFRPIADID